MRDGPVSSGRKVVFAIPSPQALYPLHAVGSLIEAGRQMTKAGIEWGLIYQEGSSIVSMARNSLVRTFLETEGVTEIIFLDSDILFSAPAILRLVAWGEDRPIVSAAYRYKEDEVRFSVKPVVDENNRIAFDKSGRLLKIQAIGLGFTSIKREVFQTMDDHLDPPVYKDRHGEDVRAYFHFDVDRENKQYVGEDIYFCMKAMECGYDLWCDPQIELTHVGSKQYTGKLSDLFQVTKLKDAEKEIA